MKNKIKLLIGIAVLGLAMITQAQTNNPAPSIQQGLEEIGNAVSSSTNWTVIAGFGRSTTGSRNLAFADVAYNFNANVGIVAGYDDLWASGQKSELNAVKGGVTLSATIHPFAFLGSTFLTNIVGTPFVADLLATPQGSGNAVGNIVTSGMNFDFVSFKNFELVGGAQYENRTGEGFWDGNYVLFHLGISRRF